MDEYNWDDFDTQTAEYLTNDPTWSNYDWSPEQSSWIDANYGDWLNDYSSVPMYLDPNTAAYEAPVWLPEQPQFSFDFGSYLQPSSLSGLTDLGLIPSQIGGLDVSMAPYNDNYLSAANANALSLGLPFDTNLNLSGDEAFLQTYMATGNPAVAEQARREAEQMAEEKVLEEQGGTFTGLQAPKIRDIGFNYLTDGDGRLIYGVDGRPMQSGATEGYLDPATGRVVSLGSTEGINLPNRDMSGADVALLTPEGRRMYADAFRDPVTGKLPAEVADVLDYYAGYSTSDPTKDPFLSSTITDYAKQSGVSDLNKLVSKLLGTAAERTLTPKERLDEERAKAQARAWEQYNKQAAAKAAYENSGTGKALTGLQGALAVAQALMGKNKGATTTARGNQGQAFSPTYVGSSAPKTLYAKGGKIEGKGGLLNLAEQMAYQLANTKGLINGEGGGQDDVVDIKAAPGEYVMDAEIVSALGDGNNEEGARKLDEMRVNIRKHKRTGGLTSIPPKAKAPEQYMKKGK